MTPDASDEFSAGGVVVRGDEVRGDRARQARRRGDRVLGLPKGHPDGDETAEAAATREVREETGVDGRADRRRSARSATPTSATADGARSWSRFFLFEYRSGDLADHDHEIEEARWMPIEEAVAALTYEGEREMVARALSRTAPDL